jgi:membrane protein YqaA with SNARE-associated domain
VAGYLIGLWAFSAIEPWLMQSHYWPAFLKAQEWFDEWGFWAVFIAGFSPIPYKAFTIAAGVAAMPLLPFVLASLIGRGGRFYLVALLMRWGGSAMEEALARIVDRFGWITVGLLLLALAWKAWS